VSGTALDDLVITFTDEVHEDVCEAPNSTCSKAAIWDLINGCGCTWAICHDHKVWGEKKFRELFPDGTGYMCARCLANEPPYRFVPHRRNR
jgi:hypothetical protein